MYFGWRLCYQNVNSHGVWNLLSVFSPPFEAYRVQRENKEVENRLKKIMTIKETIFSTPTVTEEKQICKDWAGKSVLRAPAASSLRRLCIHPFASQASWELPSRGAKHYDGNNIWESDYQEMDASQLRAGQIWKIFSGTTQYRLEASRDNTMLRGLTGLSRWVYWRGLSLSDGQGRSFTGLEKGRCRHVVGIESMHRSGW